MVATLKEHKVYFHGGAPGMRVGQMLLPPCATGAPSCSEYGAEHVHRKDRVYIADQFEAALIFAACHFSGKGTVYECKPVGEIEPDPDCDMPGLSFQCEMARITKVHRIYPSIRDQVRATLFGPLGTMLGK